MITVNSLSGGESSSYMAVHYPADINIFAVVCIEDCPEHKTDPYLVRYARDKFEKFCPNYPDFKVTAEDDDTLWAMIQLEQHIGKEIIWVRGKSFDEVIDEGTKTRLPSWARRYCTDKMKMLPIFEYLYINSYLPCHMNIGYRADETTDRIKKMYQYSDNGIWKDKVPGPHFFHYPINCRTYGQQKQTWEYVHYRRCHFPMVKDHVTRPMVKAEFKGKIIFPEISNCEGCFHKQPEVIAYKCRKSPTKMPWWIRQEKKGKGRWYDMPLTYEDIANSKLPLMLDLMDNIAMGGHCDSEGCTN